MNTIDSNNNNKHVYAGQLNSFTQLRALQKLHDRGILGLVSWRRWLADLSVAGMTYRGTGSYEIYRQKSSPINLW
jgi:hypothetical protein